MIRTPDQRLRVFVSSTLQELAPERAAAQEAINRLRLVPVMFELGARPHPPRDLYRAYLAQSHVFVGLYWQRYGWVAPDMDVSGLEDEWLLASEHPRLVYIKDPAPEREARLHDLLDLIRDESATSYRSFATAAELRELLELDLAVMLSEQFEAALAPSTPSDTATPAPLRAPELSMPTPPAPIIGRDMELATLSDLLAHDGTRLVTITGPGGSGKTRLALALGARVRDTTDVDACFVDLTGLRSSDLVLLTIAQTLGISDSEERSLVEAIATVIGNRRVLLIVDNFEHVIDAARDVGELLAATSSLKILVTSRQPLHLRWEQEYVLLPLEVPERDERTEVDAVAATAAVELLVERARRVRPNLVLDEANAASIAEITRRLDGLPLAIELAAARLRVLSPEDLLDRLEHRLDSLSASAPDMPGRHRTLRQAIAWSHDLLGEEEQIVFRRMSVFAGGAGLEAIEAVCGGEDIDTARILDIVADLVDKSLVVSGGDLGLGQTRLFLLETMREFAAEQLLASGETEATWDRHLEWSVALARRAWDRLLTADEVAWLDVLEREHDNLRSALDHAHGAGDTSSGLRIGHLIWPFWDIRGHYREGARRLRDLIGRADDHQHPAYGRALVSLGWFTGLLGDFASGLDSMRRGLEIVRVHGTADELAWSLGETGNVAFSLGEADLARELFTESLAIARELGELTLLGLGEFGLAYVAFLDGDLPEMVSRLEASNRHLAEAEVPWGLGWTRFSLAVVAAMEERWDDAVPHVTASLEQRWQIRDTRGIAESLHLLSMVACNCGEPEWSARLHGAAQLQRDATGLTILPFLAPLHEATLAQLRDHLGEERYEQLWQEGRSAPLDKIVAESLARATAGGHPATTR